MPASKQSLLPPRAPRETMIPENWSVYKQDETGKYVVVAPPASLDNRQRRGFRGTCWSYTMVFEVAAFVVCCALTEYYDLSWIIGAFCFGVIMFFGMLLPEEQERQGVWLSALFLYALIAGWYGWEAACKGHFMHWDTCKKNWSRLDLMVLIGRASAKLISMALTFLILIAVRSVSSALNYLPPNNRGWLNWRTFHMIWASFMVVLSIFHSLAHLLRLFLNHDNLWDWWYEWWELGSGISLWVMLLILGLPYYYVRVVHFLTGGNQDDDDAADTACPQCLKNFFRWTHRVTAVIFAFVFFFHSYSTGPSIMMFFWYMDYRAHQIFYPRANGPVPTEYLPKKNDTEEELNRKWQGFLEWRAAFTNNKPLTLQFDKCEGRPHEFGVYYQVEVADDPKRFWRWPFGISSSFTGATDSLSTNEDGVVVSRLTFEIDTKSKPVLVRRLAQKVSEVKVESIHDLHELNRKLNVRIYGPYHSIDYTFRSARSVVSLTSGIGNTVWENLSSHHESEARQWKPLIGIKFRSLRSAPGTMTPAEQKTVQTFEDFLRTAYEAPRDDAAGSDKIYSVELFSDLKKDVNSHITHDLITFILWVERDVLRLRKERVKADSKDGEHDNPETQFIACGNLANKVVRRAVHRAGQKGNTWKKLIHEEDFEVQMGDMISIRSLLEGLYDTVCCSRGAPQLPNEVAVGANGDEAAQNLV